MEKFKHVQKENTKNSHMPIAQFLPLPTHGQSYFIYAPALCYFEANLKISKCFSMYSKRTLSFFFLLTHAQYHITLTMLIIIALNCQITWLSHTCFSGLFGLIRIQIRSTTIGYLSSKLLVFLSLSLPLKYIFLKNKDQVICPVAFLIVWNLPIVSHD